ncbi:MAG: hypothetical protein ACLPYS_02265 [Vulcanimicrobiaceae bacterium]
MSKYHVGAVVQGASGTLYAGMNLEFAGQTLAATVHAEAAAVSNAWLHDEIGIVSLASSAPPDGDVLQFLSEFVAPSRLRIWMPNGRTVTLHEALPLLDFRTDPNKTIGRWPYATSY